MSREAVRHNSDIVRDPFGAVVFWVGRSKEWVRQFFSRLDEYPHVQCVVLIGSAVRLPGHERSDFDLLVVHDDEACPKIDAPLEVDVRRCSRSELEQKIAAGDEVACWALRYGISAYDPEGIWDDLTERYRGRVPLPSRADAKKRALKSLHRAQEMLGNGDEFAAADLVLAALTQFVRSELIAAGVFPASRPELPAQLRAVAPESRLATLLEKAMYGDEESSRLIADTASVVGTD